MGKNFATNLKKYIEQDKIYQDYKKGKLEDKSDFDEFCINHCEDIKNALDEILKLKDKYDKDIEHLGKIADDYRDKNKELKSLCDEYEKEHKTTFEYWKHLIKEDYKTRIDKAIEYINVINENTPSSTRKDYVKMILINYEDLLNILKGDNK
jgi:DNA repair ATPase RecN